MSWLERDAVGIWNKQQQHDAMWLEYIPQFCKHIIYMNFSLLAETLPVGLLQLLEC